MLRFFTIFALELSWGPEAVMWYTRQSLLRRATHLSFLENCQIMKLFVYN